MDRSKFTELLRQFDDRKQNLFGGVIGGQQIEIINILLTFLNNSLFEFMAKTQNMNTFLGQYRFEENMQFSVKQK